MVVHVDCEDFASKTNREGSKKLLLYHFVDSSTSACKLCNAAVKHPECH